MSEVFEIPADYSCEGCSSNNGQWIHKMTGDGVGILCQECGVVTERLRSWRDEARSLRKIQCVGCEHIWNGKLDEDGSTPCPECGKTDDLIVYLKESFPVGVFRTNRDDMWNRAEEVYLRTLRKTAKHYCDGCIDYRNKECYAQMDSLYMEFSCYRSPPGAPDNE